MVLLEGTKERVLELLRARPRTAKEVAEALGVSRTAAQKHLQDLEERGLAASEVRKCPGRGRPYRVWRALDPEAPYAALCGDVLKGLEAALGREGVVRVLLERNRALLAPLGLEGLPVRARLERLAAFLRERGYDVPSSPSPRSTRPCAKASFWPTRRPWASPWRGRSGSPRGGGAAATG